MSKPAPGMGSNAKQPRGSAPEMATETIATTFDKGGNDEPVVWKNGDNQKWVDEGDDD